MLLQNTKQSNLSLGWKFSDFVEEDSAHLPAQTGPGAAESRREGTLFMTEHSEAIRSRGIAAQFTLTTRAKHDLIFDVWARATSSLPVSCSP